MELYGVKSVNDVVANNTGNINLPLNIIEKTKTEIDSLISTNSLTVGSTYEITGVHPTLYNDGITSGTTIYLQALTTNALSKEGYGEFWNPKYDPSLSDFNVLR